MFLIDNWGRGRSEWSKNKIYSEKIKTYVICFQG